MTTSLIPPEIATGALESWSANIMDVIAKSTPDNSLSHARLGNESLANAIANRSGLSSAFMRDVIRKVDNFMINNNMLAGNARPATESLQQTREAPKISSYLKKSVSVDELDRSSVTNLVRDCLPTASADVVASTARTIAGILTNADKVNTILDTSRGPATQATNSYEMPLYDATGPRAYSRFVDSGGINAHLNSALESFGTSINQLEINNRLAVTATIARTQSSVIDKLFPRITDESNAVVYVIPNPVLFSLDRMSNHSADVRNAPETEVALLNINTDPGIVNTTPQSVMDNLNVINDTGVDKFIDTESYPGKMTLRAIGIPMSLLDLCNDQNRPSFAQSNHTDQLADGGRVKFIVVKFTKKSGSDTVVEYHPVEVGAFPLSNYANTNSNSDSSDCIVAIQETPLILSALSLTTGGVPTTIFSGLGKANVRCLVTFNSNCRLKYCTVDGSGGVRVTPIAALGVSEDSAASDVAAAATMLKDVSAEVYSFYPELYFNEENLRKSVLGARVNWSQKTVYIPQGKNILVDSALGQAREEVPIQTAQVALSVGNSDRGLAVLDSKFGEIADLIRLEGHGADIYRTNRLQNLSFAGTQCRPYVVEAAIDYSRINVSVMRESERMADRTAKINQMLLNGLSNVVTNSLLATQYTNGEPIVFKAIMHQVTADLLFKIPAYHSELNTAMAPANNADYSYALSNGYRIDIATTTFHEWKDKIIFCNYRESNPTDLLTTAAIHDRGIFTGTAQGLNDNGATMNRDVYNSREFVIVTNPIGLKLDITNVDFDLGSLKPVDVR